MRKNIKPIKGKLPEDVKLSKKDLAKIAKEKFELPKLKKLTKKDLDGVRQTLTKVGASEKEIDAIIKDLIKHAGK